MEILEMLESDWLVFFRPGCLNLANPYAVGGNYAWPWLFVLLWPIAQLSPVAGTVVIWSLTLMVIVLRCRANLVDIALVLLAAPLWGCLWYGQLEFLGVAGLLLPPILGVPLLMMKPQGVLLAALLRIRRGSVATVSLLLLGSFVLWGWWLQPGLPNHEFNMSLWPWSIVPGLWLVWQGLRRRSDWMLCAASLCLSPYFACHSMLALIVVAPRRHKMWLIPLTWVWQIAVRYDFW